MTFIQVELQGVRPLAGAFARIRRKTNDNVAEVNAKWAPLFVSKMMDYSLVDTGYMRDSFFVVFVNNGLTMIYGNTAPYFPRREKGFVGIDSMGRHYSDPPHPMMSRAVDELYPQYLADMRKAVPNWFRS